MIDVAKHIQHWRNGADEDWDVAQGLVEQGKVRHGLFFAHLALEKILKAHVCLASNDIAPPVHNLTRLSERTSLPLDATQKKLLAEVNSFNIEGRYPELSMPSPSPSEAKNYLGRIEELLTCLKNLF